VSGVNVVFKVVLSNCHYALSFRYLIVNQNESGYE